MDANDLILLGDGHPIPQDFAAPFPEAVLPEVNRHCRVYINKFWQREIQTYLRLAVRVFLGNGAVVVVVELLRPDGGDQRYHETEDLHFL